MSFGIKRRALYNKRGNTLQCRGAFTAWSLPSLEHVLKYARIVGERVSSGGVRARVESSLEQERIGLAF